MNDGRLDASVTVPAHVVYRDFETETVVLNLQTGQYHGLNGSASAMLRALERCPSVRDAAAEVAAAYGEPADRIAADMVDLIDGLAERGLVELRPPAGPA